MRILGVDPGLTRCGLGVIETRPARASGPAAGGTRLALVDVTVARTRAGEPLEQRLLHISDEIEGWIARLTPDAVAIERVYAGSNISTVTATSQVAGLALVAAARAGIPVAMHTPTEMKAAVTGHGGAGKAQIQEMVRRILDLESPPRPADAADALALAITHAWRGSGAATDRPARTGTAKPGASTQTPAQRRWAQARLAAEGTRHTRAR